MEGDVRNMTEQQTFQSEAPRFGFRLVMIGALVVAAPSASMAAMAGPEKVTICHATGSASNPYVQITVSENAVPEGRGHNRDGHQNGEDILRPGPYDQDGRNWDVDGQTIYDDGCLTFLPDVLPPSR